MCAAELMRTACSILRIALMALPALTPAAALGVSHDPTRTVTIYLHGFETTGADRHGVYGDDIHEPLADSVAALVGLPIGEPSGPLSPNAVVGTTYYGDVAPSYYTAADRAEIDAITSLWGGGVPRYALIVAKYARHVLQRSGAQQVNIVSASLGALVARWLIEKNLENLAGDGKIARWLTIEGLVAGNWVASHDELVDLLSIVHPEPIDVLHMKYGWVEANLHTPRVDVDNPLLANILVGHVVSTDDSGNHGALRDVMLAYGEYEPNDAVQAVPDAKFRSVAPASQFLGKPPTCATFHTDHLGLQDHRAAWAEAATFVTGTRRVTVTMTSAQVMNLHEPSEPWWDWRPAEILLESRAFSPAAEARWAITEALSTHVKEGAEALLQRYQNQGDTKSLSYVLFDDFVVPEEEELRLEVHAWELDYDARYGVFETIQTPYYDDLGGGVVVVSTLTPGTYAFSNLDWNCRISVSIFDYPFPGLVGVSEPSPDHDRGLLSISPSPATSWVRIGAEFGLPSGTPATLDIADVSGRIVRRMRGVSGNVFLWDGRDSDGGRAAAGIYLARVCAAGIVRRGKICLVR